MKLEQAKTIKPLVISDPQLLQEEIDKLILRLQDLLDGSIEYVQIWLNAPHPDLAGRTPMSYLKEGKIEVVESLIWAMETGQPE
ncbi:MbcA/ParS/Xre antitoxin family protein [Argonema galeatum]|uniref:MbcA/ParS/Xre antitoxin family protein n=1 Tax=Argonema galeatum TaxID=2942762 RepID=UPI00201201B2|nr:MbcA/ParS/Xre antitoxin family protein [Argonema galeatum]MCL1465019.1 MbcA/ParS/Xre antitoxin family protein [Argonema galeatum A003/A1]